MNEFFESASNLIPKSYVTLACQAKNARDNKIKDLFCHVSVNINK